MYKNEDEFVRGQKMKLAIIAAIMAILIINHFVTGAPILR